MNKYILYDKKQAKSIQHILADIGTNTFHTCAYNRLYHTSLYLATIGHTSQHTLTNHTVSFAKSLLLLIFILIYCCVLLPYGFEVIDPCAGTPGYNFTLGYFLLALFPIATGLLVYMLHKKGRFVLTSAIKIIFTTSLCLLVAMLFTLLWFFVETTVAQHLSHTNLFVYIFEYGCYGDIETRSWLLDSLYSVFALFAICISLKMNPIKQSLAVRD